MFYFQYLLWAVDLSSTWCSCSWFLFLAIFCIVFRCKITSTAYIGLFWWSACFLFWAEPTLLYARDYGRDVDRGWSIIFMLVHRQFTTWYALVLAWQSFKWLYKVCYSQSFKDQPFHCTIFRQPLLQPWSSSGGNGWALGHGPAPGIPAMDCTIYQGQGSRDLL